MTLIEKARLKAAKLIELDAAGQLLNRKAVIDALRAAFPELAYYAVVTAVGRAAQAEAARRADPAEFAADARLTIAQAARETERLFKAGRISRSCTDRAIRRAVERGSIPARQDETRHWTMEYAALLNWLDNGPHTPAEARRHNQARPGPQEE